jgi:hypothetical protein
LDADGGTGVGRRALLQKLPDAPVGTGHGDRVGEARLNIRRELSVRLREGTGEPDHAPGKSVRDRNPVNVYA